MNDDIVTKFDDISKELRTVSNAMTILQVDANYMAGEIGRLSKKVLEGDGRGSLVERVRLAEEELKNLKAQINKTQEEKWKIVAAAVSGVLGLCAAVATAVLK